MRRFNLSVFLVLTVAMFLCGENISAQRSSYNKWDQIIFRNSPPFSKRIYNQTELNFGYGAQYLDQIYEIRRAGISTLFAYRFNRAITIGVGAGLEAYNGGTLAPVYLEGQVYMNRYSQGGIKPFLTGASGFLYNVSGIETDISRFVNPGFGLLIPMTYRSSLSISLGFCTQWPQGGQRYTFLDTKIGLLFY